MWAGRSDTRRRSRRGPIDLADRPVARDEVGTSHLEVPLGDVEVGAAHTAGWDPHADLARSWVGELDPGEGPVNDRTRFAHHPAVQRGLLVAMGRGRATP